MFINRKHKPETIEKMRLAKLGKKRPLFSEEWKKNMTKHLYGNKFTKGHKLSEEHKAKIRREGTNHPMWGKRHSEETKRKIGKKSVGRFFSKETRRKMSDTRKGKIRGPHSEELKQKISLARRGKAIGASNPNWKGGVTELGIAIRSSALNRQWRLHVFRRDGFTCLDCGDGRGGNLQADHDPVPFSVLLKKHNIQTVRQAELCDELWDVRNGKTRCQACHIKTSTFGTKVKNFKV